MGKVPFENWVDIVSKARTAPEFKLEHYTVSSPTKRTRSTTRIINTGNRKAPRISPRPPRITPLKPMLKRVRR